MTTTDPAEEARVAAARDLVIRTIGKVAKPATFAMDSYIQLLAEARECQEMVDFWKKRLDRIKTSLAVLLGDAEEGTVNGEAVVTYRPIDRFKESDFKRDHPDMYQVYSHEVPKRELDVASLRRTRPDLYAEYQVKQMRITYDPPGSAKA